MRLQYSYMGTYIHQLLLFNDFTTYCRVGLLSAGADPGGVQRVPWNPPFERVSLTRDTLIERSRLRYSNRAVTVFLRGAV